MRPRYPLLLIFACVLAMPAAAARVYLKFSPANAIVLAGPARLAGKAGPNGAVSYELPARTAALVLAAPGYSARRLAVPAASPGPGAPGSAESPLEVKLERLDSELRLVAVVPVSKRPKSVEYTPDGRHLVVAPLSGTAIDILDARTGAVVARPAPPENYAKHAGFVESAFLPARGEIWVSQMYTDAVHVLSLSDFSYRATIPSGGTFPKVLLPHPDGRVFVSNWLSETVSALDPASGKRVGRYKAGGIPRGMALSSDGATLYVANFDDGTVEVLDARSLEKKRVLYDGSAGFPAGGAKRHLVVDPIRNRLYASDMARGSVFAVDLATMRHLAEIKVGDKTNTIKVSPDGRWIYVSTRGPNHAVDYELKGPAFGEFLVIDAETLAVRERHFGGNQPTGLAVSPDGRRVAFTDFLDHRVEIYEWAGEKPD